MAKVLIVPKSKLFILVITDEDMQYIECICQSKNKNRSEVVEACFHAGLVQLTTHCKCHKCERNRHDEEKNHKN